MDPYLNHPSLDLLELSLLHRTSEAEQDEVEEHLLICDACRVLQDALEEEINLIRECLRRAELLPVR